MITTPPPAPPPASQDDAVDTQLLGWIRAQLAFPHSGLGHSPATELLAWFDARDASLAAANADNASLAERVLVLDRENQRYHVEVTAANARADEAQHKEHYWWAEYRNTQMKLDAARTEITTLKTDRDSWRRVCERLETELFRYGDRLRNAAEAVSKAHAKHGHAMPYQWMELKEALNAPQLGPSGNLRAENERLREALAAMLDHSCVADSAPEDKFVEDHDAERKARAALASPQPDAGARGEPTNALDRWIAERPQYLSGYKAGLIAGRMANERETRGAVHSGNIDRDDAIRNSASVVAPFPSPEAAPPSAEHMECAQWLWDNLPLRQHENKAQWLRVATTVSVDAHQAGVREGREQAVNIMRRYEENQDLGCPEMMEELRALAPDPKEKLDE